MAEVILEPAALDDFAATSRRRLLGIDTHAYEAALADFAAARNDLGGGDTASQAGRLVDTLGELEHVNRSCEAFVAAMVALDSGPAPGLVIRAALSRGDFAAMLRSWQRLFDGDLLAAAHGIQVAQALEDAIATAADPSVSAEARAAADRRIVGLLGNLVDLGVDDDLALQAAVVTALGGDGVVALAGRLARVERDAGRPVGWVTAGTDLLADWTASAANSYDRDELAGFLDVMPAELVTTLNLLAPWGARAGAQAAANVWARPEVGRLDPVVAASLAHRGWPEPSGNLDRAAMILATNHDAAFDLLTDDVTILASLVTGTDHPAAVAAVTAGLITHPRRLFHDGTTDGVQASADAFAALMDHHAGLGSTHLTPAGRGLLERVAGFHFDLMDRGIRPAADAFLDGAHGTYAPIVNSFLHDALADNPHAVAVVAGRMAPPDVGRLIATLAYPDVGADRAVVVVGQEVSGRLDAVAAGDKAAFLERMGPQGLADLSSSAVVLASHEVLAGLGVGYADALTAMSTTDQLAWLDMLAAADDRAGYAAVLLSHSNGLPGDLLPLFLSQEAPTFLMPRSDAVIDMLASDSGDWRNWNADLYTSMFADHPDAYGLITRAIQDPAALNLDVSGTQGSLGQGGLSSGSVTIGFSKAFGDLLAGDPTLLDPALEEVDGGTERAHQILSATMDLLHRANASGAVIDSYGEQQIAQAVTDSEGELALLHPQAGDLTEVEGRFTMAGEAIGTLQAFAEPNDLRVDVVGLSRLAAVNATEKVPFLGTITSTIDDGWSLYEALDQDAGTAAAVSKEERTRIYSAIDFLTQANPDRAGILGDYGFSLDDSGSVVAPPDPFTHDPLRTTLERPRYATLFRAADGLADGLETGRAATHVPESS